MLLLFIVYLQGSSSSGTELEPGIWHRFQSGSRERAPKADSGEFEKYTIFNASVSNGTRGAFGFRLNQDAS
jgi:hypothetical protein